MDAIKKEISASTERLAWTQYEDIDNGSGLLAFKHKQSSQHLPNGMPTAISRNYYVKTKGCK